MAGWTAASGCDCGQTGGWNVAHGAECFQAHVAALHRPFRLCSSSKTPTKRVTAASLGKISTTSARRLISLAPAPRWGWVAARGCKTACVFAAGFVRLLDIDRALDEAVAIIDCGRHHRVIPAGGADGQEVASRQRRKFRWRNRAERKRDGNGRHRCRQRQGSPGEHASSSISARSGSVRQAVAYAS